MSTPDLAGALATLSGAVETADRERLRADLAMVDLSTARAELDAARRINTIALALTRLVRGSMDSDMQAIVNDKLLRVALDRLEAAMGPQGVPTAHVAPPSVDWAGTPNPAPKPNGGGVPVMARPMPTAPRPGGHAVAIPMPKLAPASRT